MITVPLVIAILIDKVSKLKNFETLERSIEKIKILEVELKIVTNFESK